MKQPMLKRPLPTNQQGFTLIEILVVIGIIAVLAAIVLVAINPARQFQQARDTERRSNVTAIIDGVGQYIADNQGNLPPAIADLDSDDGAVEIDAANYDLCSDLVPNYLPAFPQDPNNGDGADIEYDFADNDCGDTYTTGYTVSVNEGGRITISADGELDTISITR